MRNVFHSFCAFFYSLFEKKRSRNFVRR